MSLMERIPKDFYKLFSSKYTDYYMLFLTAIYEEMSLSYSVLGLTEKECRAVMNEKIAAAWRFGSVSGCTAEGFAAQGLTIILRSPIINRVSLAIMLP